MSFNGRSYAIVAANPEPQAIRLFGPGHIVRYNVLHDNYGSGVIVADNGSNVVISKNSMFNNGDSTKDVGDRVRWSSHRY